MKNGYKLGLAAVAASISLVGCGSSSSTPAEVTGQFVDTYVSGLNYACSSGTSGITNNMGEYTCLEGDTVEFSLGGYILGSATASSGIVTPEDIQPDNADAALNVAQLLQSLDSDPTDDIISIDANFTALDDVNITLDDENFDTLIVDVIDVPLVTEEDAQNHLDEAVLTVLLAGNTFYVADDVDIERIVINADVTSATFEIIAGENTGYTSTDTLLIEGEKLIINGVDYIVLAEETNDYLLFNHFSDGTPDGQVKLYSDQAAAQAYYDSLQPEPTTITQSMLDGKTFYHYENEVQYSEEIYAKMTLSGGVLTRTEVINGAAPDTFTVPYTIIEGKVRIDVPAMEGDPAEYIWWTLLSETADSWTLKDEDDQNQDGSIEFTNTLTLYLSKPADYPASL